MLKCVAGSFIEVFWSFTLLAGFTMIFAIIFVQQMSSYLMERQRNGTLAASDLSKIKVSFGSVQVAAVTLLKGFSGGSDWGEDYEMLRKSGVINGCIYLFFILFVWLSMTNIITSIFVDKAMKLAQPDLEDLLWKKNKEDIKNGYELMSIFREMDMNRSGTLSKDELDSCLTNLKLRSHFEYLGIDVKDAQTFFDMLVSIGGEKEVDMVTFVGGCLKMKGFAMNVDVLTVHFELRFIRQCMATVQKELRQVTAYMVDR